MGSCACHNDFRVFSILLRSWRSGIYASPPARDDPGFRGLYWYNESGMKKPELAKGLALESGLTEAEAADRLDRVVNEIIAKLRKGKAAPLPGLGKFTQGSDGKLAFQREGGKRRG